MLRDLSCESLAFLRGHPSRQAIRFTAPTAPTFPLQQTSVAALQIPAPIFANMVVQDGTWKEKDSTVHKNYKNGASVTYMTAFADPGVDAQCEWIVNAGTPLFKKGQVVIPTTDTVTTPRNMLIIDVDNSDFSGFPCKQMVKLQFKPVQAAALTPN